MKTDIFGETVIEKLRGVFESQGLGLLDSETDYQEIGRLKLRSWHASAAGQGRIDATYYPRHWTLELVISDCRQLLSGDYLYLCKLLNEINSVIPSGHWVNSTLTQQVELRDAILVVGEGYDKLFDHFVKSFLLNWKLFHPLTRIAIETHGNPKTLLENHLKMVKK